ncbi:unnamed protein product [Pieris macdunnoughi]|uniref:RIIa domain-containing protein n=1 Tax=Pieris macdunnoughi TaxID=345717 RepID=A0A821QSB6_9NEOP|nr:unnamed protein product [Pieris macdunnoughi]
MQKPLNENLCQISLPEGLEELMSDITREVLRAQPQNVYSFIANYLGALLEVRNNISIAAQICNNINESCYQPELVEELRNIGLIDEDVDKTADIIKEYLETDKVKETNLFLQILRKTSIQESQLAAIQSAVQRAFRKNRLSQPKINSCKKNTACEIASSTSLAGSYVALPRHVPYSAHDNLSIISEDSTVSSDTENISDICVDEVDDESDTSSLKNVTFAMTYS